MWKLLLAILSIFIIVACNNGSDKEKETSENDVDAARNFIRAALDGNYQKAKNFMLQDSLNTQLLNTFEDNYMKKMSKDDKRGYRESSIRIADVKKFNDSVSVVLYSNSYKTKGDSLKVLKMNGQYLVDFKYSFPSKNAE